MDNLTHTLVGAAMAESGARRWTPLAYAALLIGANLPDVDAAAYAWGETHALAFRRGWTHGILAMAVLPLVLTGGLLLFDRWRARRRTAPARPRARPGPLLAAATLAVWSHPLLDWMNTYGVRLLAPFSWHWYHGDAWFIADPWIWLALVTGIILARRFGPAAARAALAACVLYGVGMWGWSATVRSRIERSLGAGAHGSPVHVLASPVALNPLRRSILVEEPDTYQFGGYAPDSGFRAYGALPRNSELRPAVEASDRGRRFLVWSRYPFFRAAGSSVTVGDARYAGPAGDGWATVRIPQP